MAPWRVQVRSDVVLNWYEYLDARQIAPRMLYVKRWAPEDWPLAFQGQIHLLSSQDFALIEHEMRRTIDRRSRRRERPPYRPRLPVSTQIAAGDLVASGRGGCRRPTRHVDCARRQSPGAPAGRWTPGQCPGMAAASELIACRLVRILTDGDRMIGATSGPWRPDRSLPSARLRL